MHIFQEAVCIALDNINSKCIPFDMDEKCSDSAQVQILDTSQIYLHNFQPWYSVASLKHCINSVVSNFPTISLYSNSFIWFIHTCYMQTAKNCIRNQIGRYNLDIWLVACRCVRIEFQIHIWNRSNIHCPNEKRPHVQNIVYFVEKIKML